MKVINMEVKPTEQTYQEKFSKTFLCIHNRRQNFIEYE